MTPYEVPLTPEAQRFSIQLSGVTYGIKMVWNRMSSCWTLDVSDSFGAPLLSGIPVVTGCDLLGPHKHLGFTGSLVAQTDNNPNAVPTYADLGVTGRVYFLAEDA